MASVESSTTPIVPGRKLYVGNIEYSTTKSDIKDLFKDYETKEIEIPTARVRGKGAKDSNPTFRAKGYVFVNFGDDVDLDAVIEKFTDFEFKGRQIYLRYPKVKDETEEASKSTPEEKSTSTSSKATKKTNAKPSKSQKSNSPKEKIPFELGEKSTDTLYLTNLNFSLKGKDIKEFFESEGETPEWASVPFVTKPRHVVKKLEAAGKILERRNKGYAFVKLNLGEGETIEDKVSKFNGKQLRDRELLVSIAVDVRNVNPQDTNEADESK